MKKFLSIALAIVMVVGVVFLVGCGNKTEEPKDETPAAAETLKFGMGVVASYGDIKDASDEGDGEVELVVDIAAVTIDADGKIVKCVLDCADSKAKFTADGKAAEAGEFKTKYELGPDYGMAAYGTDVNGDGVVKEWNEQTDAFAALVVGKTVDEVKALMAEDTSGVEEVMNAGCTIHISGYVKAIEAAISNAADSKATADSTLKIGVATSQSNKDATEEANGEIGIDSTIVATALDADGKVLASSTDVAAATFTFDTKGVSATDTTAEIKTKKALGADYGMAAYGNDLNGDGEVKEWNEQGAAFDAALIGKNATEIGALAIETGYGVADLQTAGCTIHVGDMVKAAVKAATK